MPDTPSATSAPATLDFPAATLPWVDREGFPAEAARRREVGALSAEELARLESWRRDGYLLLEQAIPGELIDDLLAEYEAAWETRPDLQATVEGMGDVAFATVPPRSELEHHHFRLLDFQDVSQAARRIMFHPAIIEPLRLVFDQPPVAMQSLFFEYGSEQGLHQDFPYVQARILSHLVGCWIALEDVGPDNGPLVYCRGSHRLPKHDWGGGALAWGGKDADAVARFEEALAGRCAAAGLETETFHARRGDVFLWHAALAHGGSPVADRALTRKSLVAHYSSREGYPRDRRWPHLEPEVEEIGGGLLYRRPAAAARTAGPSFLARVKRKVKRLLGG